MLNAYLENVAKSQQNLGVIKEEIFEGGNENKQFDEDRSRNSTGSKQSLTQSQLASQKQRLDQIIANKKQSRNMNKKEWTDQQELSTENHKNQQAQPNNENSFDSINSQKASDKQDMGSNHDDDDFDEQKVKWKQINLNLKEQEQKKR